MKKYIAEIAQDEKELSSFIALLRAEGVISYLEIGSKFGGSLWRIANALPIGSLIVSVDLPNAANQPNSSRESLAECVADLKALGYNAHSILGDSTDPGVVRQVQHFGQFDAVFIDANHNLPYVKADWDNYGPMARLVAFHDIAWKRGPDHVYKTKNRIEVPQFWSELKFNYSYEEFISGPDAKDNGIGVVWRS